MGMFKLVTDAAKAAGKSDFYKHMKSRHAPKGEEGYALKSPKEKDKATFWSMMTTFRAGGRSKKAALSEYLDTEVRGGRMMAGTARQIKEAMKLGI